MAFWMFFTYKLSFLLNFYFLIGTDSQEGTEMMKKYGSKSIALLMSLIMVFSIFAPVAASAQEWVHDNHTHKDGPINYVSIGDSMVNGYGLDGYELEDGTNVNGFLQEVPGSYPVLFKEYLEEKSGSTVDLTQLATSALRAEDIWYIITYDSTTNTAVWPGDAYAEFRHDVWSGTGENKVSNYTGYSLTEMHDIYVDAITKADVISLGLGANNFSTYFTEHLSGFISGNPGVHTEPNWDYIKEHLDAATKADLTKLYEKLYTLTYDLFENPSVQEMLGGSFGSYTLEDVAKYFAEGMVYTTISFTIAYRGVIDEIKKLNPDVEIVIHNLNNWIADMSLTLGEGEDATELSVGGLFQVMYDFANAFMYAAPAYYEMQPDNELKFYFADVIGKVDMVITDIVNGTPSNLTRKRILGDLKSYGMVPGTLTLDTLVGEDGYLVEYKETGKTKRDYYKDLLYEVIEGTDYTYFDCLPSYAILKGAADANFGGDLALAATYLPEGTSMNISGMTFTYHNALYEAIKERTDNDEVMSFVMELMTTGSALNNAETYVLFELTMAKTASVGTVSASALLGFFGGGGDSAGAIGRVMEETLPTITTPFFADPLSDAFAADGDVASTFYMFGSFLAGWGIACHPSYAGHKAVADAMIDAYENGYTPKDETVKNLEILLDNAYEYAFANYGEEIDDVVVALNDAADDIDAANAIIKELNVSDDFKNTHKYLVEELENTAKTLREAAKAIDALEGEDPAEAWALVLTLEAELDDHIATIKALAKALGEETWVIVAPYVEEATEAAEYYAELVAGIIADAYAYTKEEFKDQIAGINDAYFAFVEYAGAAADKLDPALGVAVRKYLINTPADVYAIVYAYGEEAVLKFITDAANASGNVYDAVLGFAALVEAYGEDIFNIVINKAEYKDLVEEIKKTAEELKKLYDEEGKEALVAELEVKLAELYADVYDLFMATAADVDPVVAAMFKDSIATILECFGILENAGVDYSAWIGEHLKSMAGELLVSVLGNTKDLFDVAYPIFEALLVKVLKAVEVYANEVLDQLEVEFNIYAEAIKKEVEAAIAILKEELATQEELLDELYDALADLGAELNRLFDKLGSLTVYLDELYDALAALNDELDRLYAELGDLYAELLTAVGEEKAKIEAEIQRVLDQIENQIKAQIAALEAEIAKIEQQIKDTLAEIFNVEEYMETIKAQIAELEIKIAAIKAQIAEKIAYLEDEIAYFKQAFADARDNLKEIVAELSSAIEFVDEIVTELKAILDEAGDVIAALKELIEKEGGYVAEYLDALVAEFEAVFANTNAALRALMSEIQGAIDGVKNALNDYKNAIEHLKDVIQDVKDAVEYFKTVVEELKAIFADLEKAVESFKEAVENAKDAIESEVEAILAAINAIVGDFEATVEFLKDAFKNGKDFVAENKQAIIAAIKTLWENIDNAKAIIEALMKVAQDYEFVQLEEILAKLDELKKALINEIYESIKPSLSTEYNRDEDSYYVAIGASLGYDYVELLSDMLGVPASVLGMNLRVSDLRAILDATYENDEYGNAIIDEETKALLAEIYAEEIAAADLITVDFGNEDFTGYVMTQFLSYLIVTNKAQIEGMAEFVGFDLDGFNVYDPDWTRFEKLEEYVDVEAVLAAVEEELIANGIPADYTYNTTWSELLDQDVSILFEDGDDSVAFTFYPADMIMLMVESYLYAAVNYAYNCAATVEAIHAINPDAEVIMLGKFNPFEGMVIDLDGEVINVSEIAGTVVTGLNIVELMAAVSMDKTTFVDISDVETIANADGKVTFDEIVSVENLGFGTDAFMPSEAGSAYIAEQIYNALVLASCSHAYDNDCDADCNMCGAERPVGAHEYDNDCDATCNICDAIRPVEPHQYDSDCGDTTCNICGATRVPTEAHKYDNDCDADCNVCGETRIPYAHQYDNECADTTCNVCGATRVPTGAHTYDNECGDTTCNACGATRTPAAAHTYDNECGDTTCNVCGATRVPTAAHTYDNVCGDTTCNVCGATRVPTAAHTYDNECGDAICNACGATRVPTAAHTYDNECGDTTCNVCGATRTPTGAHTYDNVCGDTTCNVCGATRTPTEAHKYDNTCDKDCNVCGATRTPDAHKYDNSCDKTCNVCGATRKVDGHLYGEWVVVEKSGYKIRVCSECGHEEIKSIETSAPETTKPEETTQANNTKKKGCKGTVSVTAIALIASLGTCAVFVEKKRK